jgi:hypothetical protein
VLPVLAIVVHGEGMLRVCGAKSVLKSVPAFEPGRTPRDTHLDRRLTWHVRGCGKSRRGGAQTPA